MGVLDPSTERTPRMDDPRETLQGEPLDVTLVVMAYNEEGGLRATVEDCLDWMRRARRVAPVLVMNDGSTDRTVEIADDLVRRYANVRAHHMPKNVGQFSLLKKAWALIETTYYAAIPGDNQFDMRSFDLFLPHIGRYDVIFGFPNNEEVRGRFRTLLSYLWRIYLLGLYGIAIVYLGGLVVLPVDLVRRVETESEGFLGWYETMVRLMVGGASCIQIPFIMRERAAGESKAFNPVENLKYLVKMGVIWTKIKGPGALPAGAEWERMREVYLEYRAANPTPKNYEGDLLQTVRPPKP
jgi:glycosyltransferase involved in cell wall biosynthesis